jgi:short-subunit dehydrogenase
MSLDHLAARYGSWALVTGASSGIGRAFAESLAEAGLNVVLVARRGDALAELAADLGSRRGTQTRVIAADLGKPEGVRAVLDGTRDLDLGLLVAAAGFGTSGAFLDARLEDELEMLAVNCAAVTSLSHHFGRRFAERGRGGLVLLSSLLAFQGVPRASTYAATKAYVQTFAEGLRRELSPRGVDVIASAPGPVLSGFGARARMRMTFGLGPGDVAGPTLAALGTRTTVRPGWISKALEWSLALLPRWGRIRAIEQVMRQMTPGETKTLPQ